MEAKAIGNNLNSLIDQTFACRIDQLEQQSINVDVIDSSLIPLDSLLAMYTAGSKIGFDKDNISRDGYLIDPHVRYVIHEIQKKSTNHYDIQYDIDQVRDNDKGFWIMSTNWIDCIFLKEKATGLYQKEDAKEWIDNQKSAPMSNIIKKFRADCKLANVYHKVNFGSLCRLISAYLDPCSSWTRLEAKDPEKQSKQKMQIEMLKLYALFSRATTLNIESIGSNQIIALSHKSFYIDTTLPMVNGSDSIKKQLKFIQLVFNKYIASNIQYKKTAHNVYSGSDKCVVLVNDSAPQCNPTPNQMRRIYAYKLNFDLPSISLPSIQYEPKSYSFLSKNNLAKLFQDSYDNQLGTCTYFAYFGMISRLVIHSKKARDQFNIFKKAGSEYDLECTMFQSIQDTQFADQYTSNHVLQYPGYFSEHYAPKDACDINIKKEIKQLIQNSGSASGLLKNIYLGRYQEQLFSVSYFQHVPKTKISLMAHHMETGEYLVASCAIRSFTTVKCTQCNGYSIHDVCWVHQTKFKGNCAACQEKQEVLLDTQNCYLPLFFIKLSGSIIDPEQYGYELLSVACRVPGHIISYHKFGHKIILQDNKRVRFVTDAILQAESDTGGYKYKETFNALPNNNALQFKEINFKQAGDFSVEYSIYYKRRNSSVYDQDYKKIVDIICDSCVKCTTEPGIMMVGPDDIQINFGGQMYVINAQHKTINGNLIADIAQCTDMNDLITKSSPIASPVQNAGDMDDVVDQDMDGSLTSSFRVIPHVVRRLIPQQNQNQIPINQAITAADLTIVVGGDKKNKKSLSMALVVAIFCIIIFYYLLQQSFKIRGALDSKQPSRRIP